MDRRYELQNLKEIGVFRKSKNKIRNPISLNRRTNIYWIRSLNELHTTPKNKTVVLVSLPGITHNVLLNLLRALPQTSVCEAYGALSAFEFIENNQVDVIIVNSNLLLSERLALVRRIKSCFPSVQCIVLTVTTRNHESIRTSGADQVLMQDTSLAEMERTIMAL